MPENKYTERVLSSLRKLRHYARVSFIMRVANEDYASLKPLDRSDVKVILENLFEDGVAENRLFGEVSYWRIARTA